MSEETISVSKDWHNKVQFALSVLKKFDGFDWYDHDDINWRTDDSFAPITLWINCNDLFWWGTADCEEITPNNVHLLDEALSKVKALGEVAGDKFGYHGYATELFCCLSRKMRPQNCIMKKWQADEKKKLLLPLFEACGPERTDKECG